MTTEVKNNVEEVPAQEATQAPAADLTVNDLAAFRSIIEVASQRGAFKAAELETVGKSFNKLNAFLESVTASKEA
jgi:hypothetical protein